MKTARRFFGMWAILGVLGCSVVPMVYAQTDANSQTNTAGGYEENSGPDMGWIGLVGLAGLMGLRRRPANNDLHVGRTAKA